MKHCDTIYMASIVIDKKETSKPDRGVIKFQRKVLNQAGVVVQEMEAFIMYRRRPQAAVQAQARCNPGEIS